MTIEEHPDGYYEATGPMEFNNITEVKDALKIGEREPEPLINAELLNRYHYLKQLPLEDLVLKTPLAKNGDAVQYIR